MILLFATVARLPRTVFRDELDAGVLEDSPKCNGIGLSHHRYAVDRLDPDYERQGHPCVPGQVGLFYAGEDATLPDLASHAEISSPM